ncbi:MULTISPECIES: 2Fe-2S iron-sulfur cluster-binding protein [Piscirickettsiaceae]|jgi:ferredoxin|uniref:2Fe-2S iron-sulfur cluster binding domain-containing protein n=1 Tax=Hydrogenovibrio thermophilus TaxID=265883 RepID=A0A410H1J6_9GAMM|nr:MULTISPECIES: 2Fe-2S iron-sulfur cluster binding domain-containing protein [Piscirickettsiaceae]AZR82660.1 ferredoxin [Thiomicrospira sp. S5]QAB14774.1 2Fe-2S iron-sulfur cluster binding domain-containing protein [Hydrogenovibrio thermophilus]
MPKIKVSGQGECEFDGQFSLLDALDEAGFDMPYSCRGGNCGACEVRLVSGDVEEIQDPVYETDSGYILTCSVIPLSDIEIELV